jgi:single-strand DNA-binding protein
MKCGVNRVTLVGNVGDEPRVSEKEGATFVASFPLATNEHYRNKEGEEVSKTEWHHSVVNVVTFNTQYLRRLTFN